ncbi:Mitochondrial proton/calcium exchanger protein [Holothuria leucospilota]|uniref:Mitochondrial proton/calcium exchanger protein n=1 Tax=Holothuria leucospilota TaxID=206669 RepID=A0A9Q0YSQ4_HOLLE|nr:Mitochondrial proton/calcium exchanger protein [Holothuria leucospilota]
MTNEFCNSKSLEEAILNRIETDMSGVSRYVVYRKHLPRLMNVAYLKKQEVLFSATQHHYYYHSGCRCDRHRVAVERKVYSLPTLDASRNAYFSNLLKAQRVKTQPFLRDSVTLLSRHQNQLIWPSRPHISPLHTSPWYSEPGEGESKVEQAVKAIQEKKKTREIRELSDAEKDELKYNTPQVLLPEKKSLAIRIKDEFLHYWHGFRLLGTEMKIAGRLLWQVLNGYTLSRREYKQFTRTVADLFRMVPFMVFIIIPFMEFLLPVALYLFPNMLPSTFETKGKRTARLTKELKMKLEMAKFLQDTVEETALENSKSKSKEEATKFAHFLENVRKSGMQASNEDIMKFSKLFEDELTLDNLNRGQLIALCRLLRLQPIGTNNFLRFQLRMQLRSLMADDKMIYKEGIDSLDVQELQAACQARGMRALGVPVERLRSQLQQWLDLHLNEQIPTSLLLLSRALYLPESLTPSDALQATIASLPEETGAEAKLKLAEMQGEKLDNTERLKLVKKEEEIIKKEKIQTAEIEKQEQEKKAELMKEKAEEELVDKAPILETPPVKKPVEEAAEEVSKEELKDIGEVISKIAEEKESLSQEKEDLMELKQDVEEYKEDLEDLKKEQEEDVSLKSLSESKASLRMSKQVDRMMGRLDTIVSELEKEKHSLVQEKKTLQEDLKVHQEMMEVNGEKDKAQQMLVEEEKMQAAEEKVQAQIDRKKKSIIRVEELVEAMKKLDKVADAEKFQRIFDAFDEDKDGVIESSEVLNVIETISREDVALSTKQIGEVMDLLSKEEILDELERDVEKVQKDIEGQ